MRYLHIVHHGVTGLCLQLQMDADHSLVVVCGLFHGNETSADGRSRAVQHNVESSLATIKAHVHIDHVGRFPICSRLATTDRFAVLPRPNCCPSYWKTHSSLASAVTQKRSLAITSWRNSGYTPCRTTNGSFC